MDNLRRIPLLVMIGKWLLPSLTIEVRNKHSGYSRAKVNRYEPRSSEKMALTNSHSRLEKRHSARKDFLTNIIEQVESGEVSREEITAHASTLMYATLSSHPARSAKLSLLSESRAEKLFRLSSLRLHTISWPIPTVVRNSPARSAIVIIPMPKLTQLPLNSYHIFKP